MFQIKQLIGPKKLVNLTEDQKKVLMILSNNNKYQYEDLLHSTPEDLNRMIQGYYEEKPILDDLSKHGVKVSTLYYLLAKDFDEKSYEKAIPILIHWLQKEDVSNTTKAEIVKALGSRLVSKPYSFDVILDQFKKLSTEDLQRREGFYNWYVIILGNIISSWIDDAHADTLFNLLESDKNRDNSFLLYALAKLKNAENKQKAISLAINELNQPNHSNEAIVNLMGILKQFKVSQSKKLIESFLEFPKNYTRKTYKNGFGTVKDKDIRKVAQKTLSSLE